MRRALAQHLRYAIPAAARLTRNLRLHTLDRRLQVAADRLGVGAKEN